jgi:hypothetical protein
MKKILLLIFTVSLLFPALTAAQDENPFGVILYAEGSEFSLYRNGEYKTNSIPRGNVFGMPLFKGDMIQTADNTYLEIQLYPTKSVVKVAENTTFTVKDLGGGETSFNLTYGRIRAKVQRLSSRGRFEIRGKEAVAGVRGTDFGVDVIIDPETDQEEALGSVYCFEGSVSVTVTDEEEESAVLEANQMIIIKEKAVQTDEAETPSILTEKKAVAPEIVTFWNTNNFRKEPVEPVQLDTVFPGLFKKVEEITGKPVLTASETQEQKGEIIIAPADKKTAEEDGEEEKEFQFFLKDHQALRLGYGLFAGGLAMEAAGFAWAYAGEGFWSWLNIPQNRTGGHALMISGGIITVAGAASVIIGYILK